MSPFTYVPRTEAQVSKRANQSGSNYASVIQDQFNTFSAKDGENSIRILPPTWENPEHYGYDIWVHFNVGPEGGTVLCPSRMKHQPCPICEFQSKAETAGREDAADFKPKRRVAVWLVDLKAEKQEDNPAIWTMPWTVDRDISKVCKDRESGELYMIDHPTAGYNVYFDKTGKDISTKYMGYSISKKYTSVDQKYIDFVAANPLPSCLLWRDAKEIQDLFEGEAPPKKEEGQPVADLARNPAPAPVQVPLVIPPATSVAAPVPPPKQFVSEWVMDNGQVVKCKTCGKDLYTISPEDATCEGAHRVPLSVVFAPPTPPPSPVTIMPPPPVQAAPPVAAPSKIDEKANAMRSRFQTGAK